MTGDEIVALSKKHTLFEWAVQGAGRSDSGGAGQGHLLLDAGREAVHRLQQPVDVGEHRPRRRAGHHGDPATGGAADLRGACMATEPRARLGAKLAEMTPGRHRRLLLHQRRRRGQRERVQDRALRDRPPQDPGALPLVSRRHRRRHHGDRRSAPLVAVAVCPASSTCSIRITASSRVGFGGDVAALSRGGHPARRTGHDCGVHSGDR